MSDNKHNSDNLEHRLDQAKQTAQNLLDKQKTVIVSKENVVDIATTRSGKDIVLWCIAIIALIASTLVSTYLSKYWVVATDQMAQLAITVVLVVVATVSLMFTHQGSAFKTLLKDAGIELRRVTWPSKEETFKYMWQVILVMIIAGIIVWLLDMFFNYLLSFILQ